MGEGSGSARASPLGATIALTGAVFASFATIQTRRLTKTEGTGAIVFYLTIATSLFGLASIFLPQFAAFAPALTRQDWIIPGWVDVPLLLAVGMLGGVGQLLLTGAQRHADASVIAPFDYMSMLWALALGALVFGETASAPVLTGACLVIGAGVFVIWREHRLGLLRAEPGIMPPQ